MWGGVQPHLGPWPLTKNLLAMGLHDGPKVGLTFCIILLAWKCDETNFKLLLRKKVFKTKSEDFSQISNYFKKMNNINIITTEPFRNITYIQCRIA